MPGRSDLFRGTVITRGGRVTRPTFAKASVDKPA